MPNKLGQIIGVQKHSFNIKNDNEEKVALSITIDFSTATDADIIAWLVSNRTIAGQRPWRSLSVAELNDLDGTSFVAQNIGQKVKSRVERIQALVNAGLPEKLAAFAVDNPEEFNTTVEDIAVPEPVTDTPTE